VHASAWSFTASAPSGGTDNAAQIAWLGQWLDTSGPPYLNYGLGVTNKDDSSSGGDGSGSNSQHTNDNVGRYDFIAFLFNRTVDLGGVLLDAFSYGSLGPDSDITVYMGNLAGGTDTAVYNAINQKLLSELNFLTGPVNNNVNTNTSSADRWAMFNDPSLTGNLLIVLASTSSSDRDDLIKIGGLKVYDAPEPGTLALLGAGLAGLVGLGAFRRRRKAKAQVG
jgi:hypothetical protein